MIHDELYKKTAREATEANFRWAMVYEKLRYDLDAQKDRVIELEQQAASEFKVVVPADPKPIPELKIEVKTGSGGAEVIIDGREYFMTHDSRWTIKTGSV